MRDWKPLRPPEEAKIVNLNPCKWHADLNEPYAPACYYCRKKNENPATPAEKYATAHPDEAVIATPEGEIVRTLTATENSPVTLEQAASTLSPQEVQERRKEKEAILGTMTAPKALENMTSEERKNTPLYSGVLAYFPDALAAVAQLSKFGNDKHNPGQPLHWAKEKSKDHLDCIARHLAGQGTLDPESGFLHDVGLAWRALANLQTIIDKTKGRQ